jgi:hypothetical protein
MVYGTERTVGGYQMLCLSQNDIEIIGESLLQDYAKHYRANIRFPFDIDAFARDYLKLEILHRKLSDSGTIMGLTTYKDVQLELKFNVGSVVISVPEDTILLDDTLMGTEKRRRERFTIAHECGHQIIARIEERETGNSFRKEIVPGRTYSCREIKTVEDWSEWQANSLGAVLLMPRSRITTDLNMGYAPFKPTLYGNWFNTPDYMRIKSLSNKYGVSVTAMTARLRELGCVCRKPESEYVDPLVIEAG